MIGTLLNVTAIVAGGVAGLTMARELSHPWQLRLKLGLGAFTLYAGASLIWQSLSGSLLHVLAQFSTACLALILGNLVGKLLRLQEGLNRLGRYAREQLAKAGEESGNRFSEGFVTCSLLFCVGPMALLGALRDGLNGDIKLLAIKSVMDGLATVAFSKTFGWGVILSAVPVLAYQGTITLGARFFQPVLAHKELLDSINATGGLLILCLALIIFDVRRVRVADYMPSLIIAPVLTWLWMN